MSASQEKLRRREDKDSGVTDKKAVKAAEKAKEIKKRRTITIIVIAVFVVLAAFAIFFSSSALYRNFTAAELNGREFSVCEFNYYYYKSYNEYKSMMGQMMQSIPGADEKDTAIESAGKLKNQIMDEETGQTYGEYFMELAQSLMRETMSGYDAAMEAGYELPQEKLDEINAQLDGMDSMASYYGYSNINGYLASIYGKGMTKDLMREFIIRDTISTEYKEFYKASFEYSDEEVKAKYEENKDNYDTYNLRYFYVDGKEDGGDATDASKAAALERAKEFQSKITDEQSFIDLSYEYAKDEEKADYEDPDYTIRHYIGEGLVSYYKDWLIDAGRQEGDTYIAEAVNGYYVLYFLNRDENQYNTRDVRLITFKVAEADEGDYETEEEKNQINDGYRKDAEKSTNDIYQNWQDEGGTIEKFSEIAKTYSDTMDEGLNEYVNKYTFNKDLSDWIFASSRKVGDSGIVYSESYNTFYIVYYVGENDVYAYHSAEDDLRQEDYQDWYTELSESYPEVELTWFAKFVG